MQRDMLPTPADLRVRFDYYLARVLKGERMATDSGLAPEVVDALDAVAVASPNPNPALIAVAKTTLNRWIGPQT